MSTASPVHEALLTQPGQGRRIHVLGNDVIIRISSRESGGAFTVFEGHIDPQQGPPLHRHSQHDEWWYIVEGEFRFEVDGREVHAHPGDTVFAPRGSVHTFQNVGAGPGRTLTTTVPGGIDEFFAEVEKVAPRGTPPDRARLLDVGRKYNQELLGPPLGRR